MTPASFAAECESIGRNCEFGVVQRELGLDPISLLRWAESSLPGLIRGLRNEFAGLAQDMTGTPEHRDNGPLRNYWLLTCRQYDFEFQVRTDEAVATANEAAALHRRRLRWLAARLLAGIRASEKILIYSSGELHTADDAGGLIEAVRHVGPCPMLIALQVPGSDGRIRDGGPGVWFAEMPTLTQMTWAGGADLVMWNKVLHRFAARLGFPLTDDAAIEAEAHPGPADAMTPALREPAPEVVFPVSVDSEAGTAAAPAPPDPGRRAKDLAASGQADAALELWGELRRSHPGMGDAWREAAALLQGQHRFNEAETLLAEARARFPDDADVTAAWAGLATAQRNWPEAARRWPLARAQAPRVIRSYVAEGLALRELGRLDDADAVLAEAGQTFPDEPGPFIEFAWIAHIRRDWADALRRWDTVMARFPDQVGAYVGGGIALRELRRLDEADARLAIGRDRFPDDAGAAIEFGWIASVRRDWHEALLRWTHTRERFPDHAASLVGTGIALRELGRQDEAEATLKTARQRFPGDIGGAIEFALTAHIRRDWPEASRRWDEARAVAPAHPAGYVRGAEALRFLGRATDAETLLRTACAQMPGEAEPLAALARLVEEKDDPAQTELAWQDLLARFPNSVDGLAGAASARRGQSRFAAAEDLIEGALVRLPNEPVLAEQHALNAIAREAWSAALTRLEAGSRRFPDSTAIRQRLYEVRMRMAESGHAPAPAPEEGGSDADRVLAMNFESLGGGGHGCEFGIFQRAMGAEPLGLLRWADLDHVRLIAALDNEFQGVGEPEFTNIFVPEMGGRPQYWTTDTRYHMAMNTFVYADDVPAGRMTKLVHQRMRFLRAKLVGDLREGTKIFVYKNLARNLTDGELTSLRAAVSRYGVNTLLYICYEDAGHPNGTVVMRGPGLIVGYLDHFSHTPDTDQLIGPAHGQFLTLCRGAYKLWRAAAPTPPGANAWD